MAKCGDKLAKTLSETQVHAQKCANPYPMKWPTVSEEVEFKCCEQLKSIFSQYKDCLRTIKKKPKWKKTAKDEEVDQLTETEKQQKLKLSSQLVIGLSSVIRCLESDRLSLVLLAKDTQPAVLKSTIFHLVQRQGCVGASIAGLHAAVKQSWPSLSALTALGILKSEATNDFDDLVEYVKKHAPYVGHIDEALYPTSQNNEQLQSQSKGNNSADKNSKNAAKGDYSNSSNLEVKRLDGLEGSGENVTKTTATIPLSVNKYYIYKTENKSFGADNFISFSSVEKVVNSTVEVGNGETITTGDNGKKTVSYGIKPNIEMNATGMGTSSNVTGMKRKSEGRDDSTPAKMKSSFKGLNVKQMKPSKVKEQKAKKRMKKNKKNGK